MQNEFYCPLMNTQSFKRFLTGRFFKFQSKSQKSTQRTSRTSFIALDAIANDDKCTYFVAKRLNVDFQELVPVLPKQCPAILFNLEPRVGTNSIRNTISRDYSLSL